MSDTLAVLLGKPLSGTFRAADMEMFEFGEQLPFTDRQGRARKRGEYRLHVQCAWRIVRAGRIVVAYDDMADPPSGVSPDDFDPNEQVTNHRDELMARVLAEVSLDQRVVSAVDTTDLGDVRLTFADGSRLELFPAGSDDDNEFWRLLLPDGTHMVMSGAGLERVSPPPADGSS